MRFVAAILGLGLALPVQANTLWSLTHGSWQVKQESQRYGSRAPLTCIMQTGFRVGDDAQVGIFRVSVASPNTSVRLDVFNPPMPAHAMRNPWVLLMAGRRWEIRTEETTETPPSFSANVAEGKADIIAFMQALARAPELIMRVEGQPELTVRGLTQGRQALLAFSACMQRHTPT